MNERSLGAVTTIVMGQSPPGRTCNPNGEGLPLLNGPTEFQSNHPSARQWTTDPRRTCAVGAVLLCVRGSTTGRMNRADQIYAIGRGLCSVQVEDEDDQAFVRYALTDRLAPLLEKTTGSVFPNLSHEDISSLQIAWPDRPDRQQIGRLLGSIDGKIEHNTSVATLAHRLLQCTWRRAAGESNDYEPLGNVADIQKGLSYTGAGLGSGPPLVNLANFGIDGRFHADALKYYSGKARDRHWVRRGDLVLANTDLTQRREILGQPALVEIDEDVALFSHHVYAVRLNPDRDEDDLLWLYAALRDDAFRDRATTYATGTTVAALPRDAITTYEIPWSEPTVRHRWAKAARLLTEVARGALGESRVLASLRDALSPGLLSGELTIRDRSFGGCAR